MSPEVISKAVKAYFEALRAMDIPAIVNTFAEDAVTHDPVGSPPNLGHANIDGIRTKWQLSFSGTD